MTKERLYIFDTTLRDGAQTQGVHFSIDEKTKIAHALDNLGVDYIEGGWPGANPSDTEFFQKGLNLKNSTFTAFGIIFDFLFTRVPSTSSNKELIPFFCNSD